MSEAAVSAGFGRRVEPAGLRAHLGYLVTTVVALHVAGYCWLIAQPQAGSPFAARPVMHLRFIHRPAPVTPAVTPPVANSITAPITAPLTAPLPPPPAVLPLSNAQPLSDSPARIQPTHAPDAEARPAPAGHAGDPGSTAVAPLVSGSVPADPTADDLLERALAAAPAPGRDDDATMLADLQEQAQSIAGDAPTDGANEYLPRAMLTQGPQALGPVIIDFPLQVGQVGRFSTVLALFIDETGRVRRIRIDGTPLPEPFDAAARRGFESARFRPGQLHGQNVKSLIRIEVTFQSTPLDVEHGVKSLNFSL